MTLRPLLAVLLTSTVVASHADAGGDRSARRLRRSALAHYNDGAYGEAARDFRASYEIEPHPELLYALGQSLRLAGDCTGAIDAYQDFLITGPDEAQAAAAREKIQTCRQVLWPEPEPEPVTAPPARIAQPIARPAPPDRPARSWIRDPLGGALLAGGVAAAATGTWLVLGAEDGEDGEPPTDRRTAGGVLLGAGAGLLAAAIVRYATVGHDSGGEERPAVTASVAPGGAGLWVTGRF